MARIESLSLAQARRIVIGAQGFFSAGASANARSLLSMARRLSVIQIDSVNVLIRSHYLPLFSRLGPYDRQILERFAYRGPRKLFEYWAHEASLAPVEYYPLFRWRMERARDGRGMWKHVSRVAREERDLVARVRKAFKDRGPLSA